MKKKYNKPGIIIESFEIAQSISAGCGAKPGGEGSTTGKPNHGDKLSCGWDMGNVSIWTSNNNNCKDIIIGENDIWQGVCYNNPNGVNTIFSS